MRLSQTRTLLLAGVIGPVLFLGVALVEGAVRPGYDPVRQFVSLLSLGDGGWRQTLNFVISGALIASFGVGLRRRSAEGSGSRWMPRLVIVVGVALICCGVFAGDPALGYPAGAPAGVPTDASWHAVLHYLASAVIFIGLPTAMVLSARRPPVEATRAWAGYSVVSALLMLGAWLAAFVVVGPTGVVETAGLWQRIAVVAGFQWLVALALVELGRLQQPAALTYAKA